MKFELVNDQIVNLEKVIMIVDQSAQNNKLQKFKESLNTIF